MTLSQFRSQFRSKLYALAKILGDVQAVAHKKPAIGTVISAMHSAVYSGMKSGASK